MVEKGLLCQAEFIRNVRDAGAMESFFRVKCGGRVDNMGLQSTQTLGPILDGIMRNTPELAGLREPRPGAQGVNRKVACAGEERRQNGEASGVRFTVCDVT